ncbi:RNA polymerase sigma factor [Puia sp. P3]|uniref:RNA polymerase sigma factor n=1 Tax=Puia sp. P3 TaxID=3423952 RepID=UPI003D666529
MAPDNPHTDESLVAALTSGDPDAFTAIYERYWDKLLVYVMRVIRRQSDAEDIVQELFVSLWKRRQELQIERSLSTYLYNSARYISIRHIEKNSTYAGYLDRLAIQMTAYSGESLGVESAIFGRELEARIDGLIGQLPEKMKEVFILSRKHHLSYREIADRLSISEETVRKQVYKSLKILREGLGLPAGLVLWLTTHFF